MSVKLIEWFPMDKAGTENRRLYENCQSILKACKLECVVCGKQLKMRSAIADHSLPWGVWADNRCWCTQKCFNKKVK